MQGTFLVLTRHSLLARVAAMDGDGEIYLTDTTFFCIPLTCCCCCCCRRLGRRSSWHGSLGTGILLARSRSTASLSVCGHVILSLQLEKLWRSLEGSVIYLVSHGPYAKAPGKKPPSSLQACDGACLCLPCGCHLSVLCSLFCSLFDLLVGSSTRIIALSDQD